MVEYVETSLEWTRQLSPSSPRPAPLSLSCPWKHHQRTALGGEEEDLHRYLEKVPCLTFPCDIRPHLQDNTILFRAITLLNKCQYSIVKIKRNFSRNIFLGGPKPSVCGYEVNCVDVGVLCWWWLGVLCPQLSSQVQVHSKSVST